MRCLCGCGSGSGSGSGCLCGIFASACLCACLMPQWNEEGPPRLGSLSRSDVIRGWSAQACGHAGQLRLIAQDRAQRARDGRENVPDRAGR
eukprot:584239-Rhodomonas_salina.3